MKITITKLITRNRMSIRMIRIAGQKEHQKDSSKTCDDNKKDNTREDDNHRDSMSEHE